MTAAAAPADRRTYWGWQRDRSSLMFGLSTTRVILLLGAVVAGVGWFVTGQRLLALPFHAAAIGLLLGLALVRVAGRTSDEWAGTAAGHALATRRRRTRFLAGPAGPVDVSTNGRRLVRRVDLPGVLAPLRTVEVPLSAEQRAAVVIHPHARLAVVVARVAAPACCWRTPARRTAGSTPGPASSPPTASTAPRSAGSRPSSGPSPTRGRR